MLLLLAHTTKLLVGWALIAVGVAVVSVGAVAAYRWRRAARKRPSRGPFTDRGARI